METQAAASRQDDNNVDDSETKTPTRKWTRQDAIVESLDRLDAEYKNLSEQQKVLQQILNKLQRDETSLSRTLEIARKVAQPPSRPSKSKPGDQAVLRLQQALLADDGSSDDSDDDEEKDNDISVNLGVLDDLEQEKIG